jgi:hypothetical protein
MSYDSWKLNNAWDEAEARVRAKRRVCDDCDSAWASVEWDADADTCLCERCADRREEAAAEEQDTFNDRVDHEFDRWHDQ